MKNFETTRLKNSQLIKRASDLPGISPIERQIWDYLKISGTGSEIKTKLNLSTAGEVWKNIEPDSPRISG